MATSSKAIVATVDAPRESDIPCVVEYQRFMHNIVEQVQKKSTHVLNNGVEVDVVHLGAIKVVITCDMIDTMFEDKKLLFRSVGDTWQGEVYTFNNEWHYYDTPAILNTWMSTKCPHAVSVGGAIALCVDLWWANEMGRATQ